MITKIIKYSVIDILDKTMVTVFGKILVDAYKSIKYRYSIGSFVMFFF